MVELNDPKSHEKFAVDVKLLLIPGAILFLLVGKYNLQMILISVDTFSPSMNGLSSFGT